MTCTHCSLFMSFVRLDNFNLFPVLYSKIDFPISYSVLSSIFIFYTLILSTCLIYVVIGLQILLFAYCFSSVRIFKNINANKTIIFIMVIMWPLFNVFLFFSEMYKFYAYINNYYDFTE